MSLLDPRIWLAALLAGGACFATGYSKGGKDCRAEQSAIALQASETRRMRERALSLDNEKVTNAYIAEKTRRAAIDADTASRLRDYQAALNSATRADTAASSGLTSTLANIANQCTTELAALDEYAGRLGTIAQALQNYAASVRLKE